MKRLVLLCTLLCLVLLACDGGGSEPTDGVSSGVADAEFIEKVDEICTEGRAELEDVEPPKTLDEAGPFLRKILPVIRDQQSELQELGDPPPENREIYFEWFEARDGIVETTALMIEAAEEGDKEAFDRLAATQSDLDAIADKAARAYGLKVCGAFGVRVRGFDGVPLWVGCGCQQVPFRPLSSRRPTQGGAGPVTDIDPRKLPDMPALMIAGPGELHEEDLEVLGRQVIAHYGDVWTAAPQ